MADPNQPRPSHPVLRKIQRTFFGEIDRQSATREIFLSLRIQTLGITISENSSVICWNVLLPTIPSDQARSVSLTPEACRVRDLSIARSSTIWSFSLGPIRSVASVAQRRATSQSWKNSFAA